MDAEQVRMVATNPDLRQILLLCKNGVPFDVASSLPDEDRIAWCIAIGEIDGGRFDWNSWKWMERDK